MTLQAPTIKEIVFNRQKRRPSCPYTVRPTIYHRGDNVVFKFGTVIRRGRITTVEQYNGISNYHIEGVGGVWYRGIDEEDIISKEV